MFDNCKIPIMSWLPFEDIDENALGQLQNCASLPFAFKRVVALPDVHFGVGISIGTVLATEKVVIPNAVGVDIGCGMCAVKTPWTVDEIDIDKLKKIMGLIREAVPVGFNHQKVVQDKELMPSLNQTFNVAEDDIEFNWGHYIVAREYQSALHQLGTLGGGNHFIEIQRDQDNNVWIMIHSGSRNIGLKVAKHYNDLAVELNGKWYAYVPKEYELAFLPWDSIEGQAYLTEMQYCVDFALANRKLMMERISESFTKVLNYKKIDMSQMINIAHNYARLEHHFGKNVMVHRKGATLASLNTVGIIPGSQGTKSYIVRGLGNPDSFLSCSHGAGRKMGRKEACRSLDLEAEKKKLDDQGIIHGIRGSKDLDEASGAYKDISQVMKNQADLVEIVTELSPMGVIKG